MICAYPVIGRLIIFKQEGEKMKESSICTINYICLRSRCMYKL